MATRFPMTRYAKLSPEDRILFRETVGSVRPVHHDRVEHNHRPRPEPRLSQDDERQVVDELLSWPEEPDELDTGEELYYRRDGVQNNVLRKLRRGQYRVSAVLDLHGMNVATARQALLHFLYTAKREHMTCVRIIHGKGLRSRHKGPVIKTKVNTWLRQRDDILAFCSARPMDGGTGAIYVLLGR